MKEKKVSGHEFGQEGAEDTGAAQESLRATREIDSSCEKLGDMEEKKY